MSNVDTAISKYRAYMKEIRYRTDVINRAISSLQGGGALTGFRESDIELIYLQFRHCLELMMFASLSAHYAHGYDLSKKLVDKEYNATRLLRFLKTKNPKFYPRPVESKDKEDAEGMFHTTPITANFLTQEDFCNLYDKSCGKLLHAQRKPKFASGHDKMVEEAVYYRDRMMKLLNCHWIELNKDFSFRVIMRDIKTGEVGLNVMQNTGKRKG